MALLNFRKKVWHNQEYKRQCGKLDIFAGICVVCIGLSFWLLPYLTDKYIYVTELFILASVIIGVWSWMVERKDNKYVPPMKNEDATNLK